MSVDQSEVVITDWPTVDHDVPLVPSGPPALQPDAGRTGCGGGGKVGRDGVVRVAAVPGPRHRSANSPLVAPFLPAGMHDGYLGDYVTTMYYLKLVDDTELIGS